MNFGIEITGNDKNIIDYLLDQKLNPGALPPTDLYRQRYKEITKEAILETISRSLDEGFYINRTRGEKFNKTYYTTKSELLTLLEEQLDNFSGLDLLVATEDFTWVFVTNHDGAVYLVV